MSDEKTLHLRPSALDRAWYCAESLRPKIAVNPVGEPAEMGSAFHEYARASTDRQEPDVTEIADRYGVSLEELERLVAYAGVAERDLSTWFSGASAEARLSHSEPWHCGPYETIELNGTVDRIKVAGEKAAILDYKTGMVEGYQHQQRAYAFLAMRGGTGISEVYGATVYVRLGYWVGRVYTANDLESWWADVKRRLANGFGQFSPGSHCGYCPRRVECPGVAAYAESCLSTINQHPAQRALQLDEGNAAALGPHLAETLRKVRYIEARCGEFRDALKQQVRKVGGEVPAGDDKVLRIIETRRRKLDPRLAWPVLSARLSDEQIADACTMSLRKCQDAVAESATGGKGAARKQLEDELIAVEAVKMERTEQLREVQK